MNRLMSIVMIIIGLVLLIFGIKNLIDDSKKTVTELPSANIDQAESSDRSDKDMSGYGGNSDTPSINVSSEDEAKIKGNNFEAYVVDVLKNRDKFRILEWNQGTTTPDGNYGENELKPDLKISMPGGNDNDIVFWIECKYRSDIKHGFNLAGYQYDRYKNHQRSTRRKVLIALGAGGESSNPENLYLIPVDSIVPDVPVYEANINRFKVHDPKENIEKHIRDYFYNHVFAKAHKIKKHV